MEKYLVIKVKRLDFSRNRPDYCQYRLDYDKKRPDSSSFRLDSHRKRPDSFQFAWILTRDALPHDRCSAKIHQKRTN